MEWVHVLTGTANLCKSFCIQNIYIGMLGFMTGGGGEYLFDAIKEIFRNIHVYK